MKHTPGPWELQKPLFGEQHIYVHSENTVNGKVKSGRQHICVVPYEGKRGSIAYHEMFKANAKLIAAAPELLAALEDIVLSVEYGASSINRLLFANARAAIIKATS